MSSCRQRKQYFTCNLVTVKQSTRSSARGGEPRGRSRSTGRTPTPGLSELLHAVADFAVFHAIGKINDQPNDEPNNQPHPGNPVQASHQPQRDNNSHDGYEGNPRCPERALQVRTTTPQNHHRRAHNDKGQERANAHHLAQAANGDKRAEDGGAQSGNRGGLPRSAKTRV